MGGWKDAVSSVFANSVTPPASAFAACGAAPTSSFAACGTPPASAWTEEGDPGSDLVLIPNREIWLAADDAAHITQATGVSAWADKTGNGRSVSQGTGAAQPSLVTGVLNGLPAIRFDGVDDVLAMAWPIQLNAGYTILIVTTPRFIPNALKNHALLRWLPSNGAGMQAESTADGNVPSQGRLEAFASTNAGLKRASPVATVAMTPRVATVLCNVASGIALYNNGALEAGPTSGFASIASTTGDTLQIGHDEIPGSNFGAYDVHEIIVWSGVLSLLQHAAAVATMRAKYAI